MKTIRSVIRKGMAAGGLLLAFAGSSVWGHSPDDQPLLSIVQPAFNSTQPGAMVVVRVHFGPRAIQRTFHAEMDGTNITNLFAPRGQCDNWGNCDMQAVLPAATLLTGTNIVTAGVSGPNEAAAVDRTSFEFTGPSARGEPVSRMIPAVSIQSVKLPVNANTNDPQQLPDRGRARTRFPAANLHHARAELQCGHQLDAGSGASASKPWPRNPRLAAAPVRVASETPSRWRPF